MVILDAICASIFAVGTRGADQNRSGACEVDFSDAFDRRKVGPESVHLATETEGKAALMDSLMLCKFLRGVFNDFIAESAEILAVSRKDGRRRVD